MEALAAAFFLVVVGGFLAGMILITIDETREWKRKREANKK